jgi:hypothetical protein
VYWLLRRVHDAGSRICSHPTVEGVVYSLLFNGDYLCHSVRKSGYEDGSWDGCKSRSTLIPPLPRPLMGK